MHALSSMLYDAIFDSAITKSIHYKKFDDTSNHFFFRAREALKQCLPDALRDSTFSATLKDDMATRRCLAQLLVNLNEE